MHDNNQWKFNGESFLKDDADSLIERGYVGFVYEISDGVNGKKYIGKKLFTRKIKRPPLKGTKRKRISIVHSDWTTYFGSSEHLKTLIEERIETFSREILFVCKSKGELNYVEAREQFARNVLLRDDYYNGIISCRINHRHVNELKLQYALENP